MKTEAFHCVAKFAGWQGKSYTVNKRLFTRQAADAWAQRQLAGATFDNDGYDKTPALEVTIQPLQLIPTGPPEQVNLTQPAARPETTFRPRHTF